MGKSGALQRTQASVTVALAVPRVVALPDHGCQLVRRLDLGATFGQEDHGSGVAAPPLFPRTSRRGTAAPQPLQPAMAASFLLQPAESSGKTSAMMRRGVLGKRF